MRVVHVVRQFSPSVGGLEDSVFNLASIQRRALGLDASVVTLDRVFRQPARLPAVDEVKGVPVRRLAWRGSSRYPVAPSVLGAIAGADLVHVHAIDFFFDFLALTKPVHGRRLVASTHGGFFHSAFASRAKRLWFGSVTRASCAAYERVIACSENDAAMFGPIAGSKLTTIENGIAVAKFADAASNEPTRTILSFGRFARHKQVHLLFPLLRRLRERRTDWQLIVAGTDSDATERELRAAAADAGVADAVRFVIEPTDSALRALMRQASFYASASSHEGFGLAAVEALSAGLIPILNDIPPFRRLVDRTGVGFVTDLSAPDASERVERFATEVGHDEARRTAVEAGASFDWRSVTERYVSLYTEVTAGRSSPMAALATAMVRS